MRKSLDQLAKAQELSDSGRHSEVVEYLSKSPLAEIEKSHTLTLLLGSAHARLGRHEEGQRLVELALDRSRERGDKAVELQALNARGVIALVTGRVDEAEDFLTRGVDAAKRQGDHAAIGRCSNNLGIIEHYRGRYGRALGAYNIALAAFQQAGSQHGVAEVQHNIGITYRDQGDLDQAFEYTQRAVRDADETGDTALHALTLSVQAEIRASMGDTKMARHEIDRALSGHRALGDLLGETGDLRILARILADEGELIEAERLLREVMTRAEAEERPRLVAAATRDLANLLIADGRKSDALDTAHAARALYEGFKAKVEIERLDAIIGKLS